MVLDVERSSRTSEPPYVPIGPKGLQEPRDLQRVFFGKTSGLSRATGRTGAGSRCLATTLRFVVSHRSSSCWLQEPDLAGHF